MIYLCQPYSSSDAEVETMRFEAANFTSAYFFGIEHMKIISPIAMWHIPSRRFNIPGSYLHFREWNETVLLKSEGLLILPLSGWRGSIGVRSELEFAASINMPLQIIRFDEDSDIDLKRYIQHVRRFEGVGI